MHALADLVLSQPDIGTAIKTDGEESSPYAFLSILNIGVHNVSFICFLSGVSQARTAIRTTCR